VEVLLALLALSHHIGDSILDGKGSTKSKRLFWAGVGVGWSAFFLIKVIQKGGIIRE
jgi:hypothetical protein